jgi:hypothetical protein
MLGWRMINKNNWQWDDFPYRRATVFADVDGTWEAAWYGARDGRGRRLKDEFRSIDVARFVVELADQEGELSPLLCPPDEQWEQDGKGGYYRRVTMNGRCVYVRPNLSDGLSWYVADMSRAKLCQGGYIVFFATAKEARRAVDSFLAGGTQFAWGCRPVG